jgi:hypothetical protein
VSATPSRFVAMHHESTMAEATAAKVETNKNAPQKW